MKGLSHGLVSAVLIAASLAEGCGTPEGGHIAITLYTSAPAGAGDIRGEVPGYIDEDITDFRICVSVLGMNDARCKNFNLEKYKSGGKARINDLPVGRERRVTFQGYDMATMEVFWCGEVSGVEIKKDSTTRVEMFISACRDFTPVRNEMDSPRVFHTATRLPDGRVLIVGGFRSLAGGELLAPIGSVDIYDPRKGEFDQDVGLSLNHPRGLHTCTLLSDGRVLVAGGCQSALLADYTQDAGPPVRVESLGDAGDSAEIVDPVGLTVEEVDGPMHERRADHAALALPGGDAFMLGGIGEDPSGNLVVLSSGDYYRASSGEFETASVLMQVPRHGFALIPYGADGTRALVWGGNQPAEPGPGIFAEVLSVNGVGEVGLDKPVFVDEQCDADIPTFHSAGTQISNGEVLVTGGVILEGVVSRGFLLISMNPGAERFNLGCDGVGMGFFAGFHTATLLSRRNKEDGEEDPDFKVLVAGGFTGQQLVFEPQSEARFFHPWENGFGSENVELVAPRAGHTATALDDGTVLFAGGFTTGSNGLEITGTAEVFNAASRQLRAE